MKKLIVSLVYTIITSITVTSAKAVGQTSDIDPRRVISAQTLDFNGDGIFDRALLVEENEDEATLLIYLSKPDRTRTVPSLDPLPNTLQLDLVKKSIAMSGSMAGQAASLIARGDTLEIHSQNISIGRIEWFQTVTIAYRDSDYRVIAYASRNRDVLSPGKWECDVDFLKGEGRFNGKLIVRKTTTEKPSLLSVRGWHYDQVPSLCVIK